MVDGPNRHNDYDETDDEEDEGRRGGRERRYLSVEGATMDSSGTRGLLRSGTAYRRSNRGHYETMRDLVKAHKKIFSQDTRLYLIGKSTA